MSLFHVDFKSPRCTGDHGIYCTKCSHADNQPSCEKNTTLKGTNISDECSLSNKLQLDFITCPSSRNEWVFLEPYKYHMSSRDNVILSHVSVLNHKCLQSIVILYDNIKLRLFVGNFNVRCSIMTL